VLKRPERGTFISALFVFWVLIPTITIEHFKESAMWKEDIFWNSH